MNFDFKHKHKSNWSVRDREPTFLEYAAMAGLFVGAMYGILWYALCQATGGI